jgi:Bacterial CdiA-CT RNAse A domain
MLSPSLTTKLLQTRYDIAAMQVRVALLRLRLALKAGFDPNQPRVPAGRPEGGQWTRVGEGVQDEAPVRVAQAPTRRRYTVNLLEEEARGGHAIRDHVAKKDEELIAVLEEDWRQVGPSRFQVVTYRPAQGGFLSLEAANDFVNRVLTANPEIVDLVASGRASKLSIERRFGYVTGKEAYRSDPYELPRIRHTYGVRVVVHHDPRRESGYFVRSAFPINEQPVLK